MEFHVASSDALRAANQRFQRAPLVWAVRGQLVSDSGTDAHCPRRTQRYGRGGRAEYSDFHEESELSAEDQRAHAIYVRRVGAEYGFPLTNWSPTIPQRDRS